MDLWQMDWTGENVTELTNGADPGQVAWNMQNERIYFLGGGRVSSRKNGGGDAMNHAFNAEFSVKALDEKLYKYNEVWRIQNKWFYDADFHGRDWNALGDEYRGLYAESRHYRDANDAMNQLLGRLNSSHLWYSEAGSPPPGPDTGYLGCEFIEDENPGLIVDRITPDTPIAREEFGIEWEDRIVSINGYDVGGWGENPVGNWWRALESTVGKSIELGYIKWDDETDTVNWIRVTPTDYWGWYQAEYENWIEGNRAYIEMLTYEQVGYLHIQRMYDDSLERFEQDLYAAANGKKALVIDVRYNSGGWTTDWLLAMLNTERHALTVPRDGGYGYPEDRTPVYTTDIPVIVLCNEWSFSNAEIFSHAIKNLGRGVLVGWPTGGGVISTGNMSLADGSRLSLPRRGWYAVNPDTMEILYNMEGQAAIPDYMYEITPWDLAAGIDPQLDLAVDAEIDMMSGGG
jgi:tricorn protease